jgi:DNA repair protein RecO (recombination protein O)
MNQQQVTTAIVLARTDYGEADRIITLLTPDVGKLRLIAKGVRRIKSKLAGGVELFSLADITYIRGRGEVGTLVSARLQTHYGHIVENIDRTMLGYDLIKQLNKATEDEPEADYYELLGQAFAALDDATIPLELVRVWFAAQLLRLSGHTPNLTHDVTGTKLAAGEQYEFSFDDQAFALRPNGHFATDDIKFLRLLFNGNQPQVLAHVANATQLAEQAAPLVNFMRQTYIR